MEKSILRGFAAFAIAMLIGLISDGETKAYANTSSKIDYTVEEVRITEENFPDEIIRGIVAKYDSNGDGTLTRKEREKVTSFHYSNYGISNVEGIGYFQNIKSIILSNNYLTELDVSMLQNITYLNVAKNYLTSIDLEGLSKIETLYVSDNKLQTLTLTQSESLQVLYGYSNELKEVTLGSVANLETIHLYNNQLTEFSLDNPEKLRYIAIDNNKLMRLDLSQAVRLKTIYANDNQLKELNIQGLYYLEILNVDDNNLEELEVEGLHYLNTLRITNNQLKQLDLSNLTYLKSVHCYNNNLSSMDISNCTQLVIVSAFSNPFLYIEATGANQITQFSTSNNTVDAPYDGTRILDVTLPENFKERATIISGEAVITDENKIQLATDYKSYTIKYQYDMGNGMSMYGYFKPLKQTKDISDSSITVQYEKELVFDAKYPNPGIQVFDQGRELIEEIDYETDRIVYSSQVGTYTWEIKGKDCYTGTRSIQFKVVPCELTSESIQVNAIPAVEFDPYGVQPLVEIYLGNQIVYQDNYDLTYTNNKKIGTAQVVITGKNNLKGSITVPFTIGKASINASWLQYSHSPEVQYTGSPVKMNSLDFCFYQDDKMVMLREGVDYVLTYTNNQKVGTAQVKVQGIGTFTGSKTISFSITRAPISWADQLDVSNQAYTGKPVIPTPTIKYNGKTLVKDVDYKVSATNNINIGVAQIKIQGINNFTGSTTLQFSIVPKAVTSVKQKKITASKITLTWSKSSGVNGYYIYQYDSKFKEYFLVGIVPDGSKTEYTVERLKANTTYKFKVSSYKKIKGQELEGIRSKELSIQTKLATPVIKLSTKSKKATISWKAIANAAGYEVQMATKKNGAYKNIAVIKKGKTISYTKTKLTKNKTYYFRVRSYKIVNKKNVYSDYSTVKSIKVK